MNVHYPHRIRLRSPWQCAPLTEAGLVRFSRRFGYPGRIDADERVWLVIEGLAAPASIALNGLCLNPAPQQAEASQIAAFDVTSLLQPRNEVAVELAAGPEPALPWQEVCLEVRRTAFLCDVRIWIEEGNVHATGLVVGHADGPLDLYLVADRGSAAYISLTPLERGQPFHLCGPADTAAVAEVKVELVQGAVLWYAVRKVFAQGPGA